MDEHARTLDRRRLSIVCDASGCDEMRPELMNNVSLSVVCIRTEIRKASFRAFAYFPARDRSRARELYCNLKILAEIRLDLVGLWELGSWVRLVGDSILISLARAFIETRGRGNEVRNIDGFPNVDALLGIEESASELDSWKPYAIKRSTLMRVR